MKKNDKYLKMLKEAGRRQHPFYRYNKGKRVHRKQLEFHKDQSKSRWIFGGNRTGKTECGAMEAIWWALGKHPYRKVVQATEGWIVSLSQKVGRDVCQEKILKYLDPVYIADIVMQSGKRDNPKSGVIDFILVQNKYGTLSKIGFKSCEQGREKFQGTGLDWVWFDEEPPEDIYEECLLRTLDKDGAVWGTMTPLKGRTWIYERIYNSGETHSIHNMAWEDNPFLKKEAIQELEKDLTQESLESRKYGRFTQGGGIVFSEFESENIIDPIPLQSHWEYTVSIDPGYAVPTAAVWIAKDGEVTYVIDDYSEAGKTIQYHAEKIIAKCEKHNLPKDEETGLFKVLMDSSALQQSLGLSKPVSQQFRDHGLDVDTGVNKNVLEGIGITKSLLRNADGARRLFVFRNCVNLIKELRSYSWNDQFQPIKKNDHCIDALRYALATRRDTKKPVNPIVKKKSDLLRRNLNGL